MGNYLKSPAFFALYQCSCHLGYLVTAQVLPYPETFNWYAITASILSQISIAFQLDCLLHESCSFLWTIASHCIRGRSKSLYTHVCLAFSGDTVVASTPKGPVSIARASGNSHVNALSCFKSIYISYIFIQHPFLFTLKTLWPTVWYGLSHTVFSPENMEHYSVVFFGWALFYVQHTCTFSLLLSLFFSLALVDSWSTLTYSYIFYIFIFLGGITVLPFEMFWSVLEWGGNDSLFVNMFYTCPYGPHQCPAHLGVSIGSFQLEAKWVTNKFCVVLHPSCLGSFHSLRTVKVLGLTGQGWIRQVRWRIRSTLKMKSCLPDAVGPMRKDYIVCVWIFM